MGERWSRRSRATSRAARSSPARPGSKAIDALLGRAGARRRARPRSRSRSARGRRATVAELVRRAGLESVERATRPRRNRAGRVGRHLVTDERDDLDRARRRRRGARGSRLVRPRRRRRPVPGRRPLRARLRPDARRRDRAHPPDQGPRRRQARPRSCTSRRWRCARSSRALGSRTRDALGAFLPGPVTLVVANPERRYPLACREDPERLGLRLIEGPLAGAACAVFQTSANRSGGPAPAASTRSTPEIVAAVDVAIDGGALTGAALDGDRPDPDRGRGGFGDPARGSAARG